jgi:hypothetical protein
MFKIKTIFLEIVALYNNKFPKLTKENKKS